MKLSELNPRMTGNGPLNQLVFDCPKCGPPYIISVHCHRADADDKRRIWKWSVPDGQFGWDVFSLSPSINNRDHGRKKLCGCHLSIVNGEVVP